MNDQTEAEVLGLDRLVSVYIKLRDQKNELRRELEEKEAELDNKMNVVKEALLEHCKTTGAESVRTAAGTFYRSIKSKYWTSDWDAMNKFILDNNAVDLLEKRLHQTNMRTFLEENPDKLPPGLNVESEYTITIRRK
jgi:hypothetical protein